MGGTFSKVPMRLICAEECVMSVQGFFFRSYVVSETPVKSEALC
jgi:hypothetical protein